MRWLHIQENWPAFFEAIESRWPKADFDDLAEIEGNQKKFIDYICTLEGTDRDDAIEQIREWMIGEVPADVVMDPIHDNHSISLSTKFLGEGETASDDDQKFGDQDVIRGDGDRTGRGDG